MHKIILGGVALASLVFLGQGAQALPVAPLHGFDAPVKAEQIQYNRWRGGGHRGGYYRGGRGVGVGAGIAGLAAGALIGGAIANSNRYYYDNPGYYGEPGYVYGTEGGVAGGDEAYCIQRFKSYDPASGTYLGYDGLRHPCP